MRLFSPKEGRKEARKEERKEGRKHAGRPMRGGGLERKLTLILLAFAAVISAAIWSIGYKTYMDSAFARYRSVAESVIKLARSIIDADDMKRCLETGVKSEIYEKTQASLDEIKENMGVYYLYFFKVKGDGKVVYFIIAFNELEKKESASWEKINTLGDEDSFPDDMTRLFTRENYADTSLLEIVNRTEYGYMLSVYSPERDSAGETIGLIGVDFDMNEINAELASYAATVAVGAFAAALTFTVLLIAFVRRSVTGPLVLIAEKTGQFVSASHEDRLLAVRLGIKKRDEIGVLASAFEKMTADLVRYVSESAAAAAAKERIESELSIARGIQAGILPSVFPAFPGASEFDLYASMTPAREVGGDFYDFFMTDDSRLALVIADVSGKGVPAALFMMVARTLIRREARSGREPNEVLERVNKTLCESNDACMFVTAFIGVYDVRTGVLRCSCAGHNPPIAIESGGGTKEVKCPPSLVLAIDEAARYSSFETAIEPGGGLLLYTDGVTEAFNAEKELFSAERLAAAVGFAGGDARSMIERVRDELRKFAAGEGQSDDITMLAFRRLK